MSGRVLAFEAELARELPTFECRVHHRRRSSLQISCQPIAAHGARDITWPAKVRDISQSGIGLILQRRFERGVPLAVELPLAATDSVGTVLARVIHTKLLGNGAWLHGCSFVRPLSEDTLHALLGYVHEQRVSSPPETIDYAGPVILASGKPWRRPGAVSQPPKRILITGVHFEGATPDGSVVRRFINRLFLAGPWPLLPGTLVQGWAGREQHGSPAFKMKVAACSLHDNQWKLICTFLDMPADRVRRVFRVGPGKD